MPSHSWELFLGFLFGIARTCWAGKDFLEQILGFVFSAWALLVDVGIAALGWLVIHKMRQVNPVKSASPLLNVWKKIVAASWWACKKSNCLHLHQEVCLPLLWVLLPADLLLLEKYQNVSEEDTNAFASSLYGPKYSVLFWDHSVNQVRDLSVNWKS